MGALRPTLFGGVSRKFLEDIHSTCVIEGQSSD